MKLWNEKDFSEQECCLRVRQDANGVKICGAEQIPWTKRILLRVKRNQLMYVHILSPNALYFELRTHCSQNVVEAIVSPAYHAWKNCHNPVSILLTLAFVAFKHSKKQRSVLLKPHLRSCVRVPFCGNHLNAQTWACCIRYFELRTHFVRNVVSQLGSHTYQGPGKPLSTFDQGLVKHWQWCWNMMKLWP